MLFINCPHCGKSLYVSSDRFLPSFKKDVTGKFHYSTYDKMSCNGCSGKFKLTDTSNAFKAFEAIYDYCEKNGYLKPDCFCIADSRITTFKKSFSKKMNCGHLWWIKKDEVEDFVNSTPDVIYLCNWLHHNENYFVTSVSDGFVVEKPTRDIIEFRWDTEW